MGEPLGPHERTKERAGEVFDGVFCGRRWAVWISEWVYWPLRRELLRYVIYGKLAIHILDTALVKSYLDKMH